MEVPPKSDSGRGNLLPCLILGILVFGVYAGALRNGFTIMDDPNYVTDNDMVKRGLTWPGIAWALTANVAENWHPVTMLSHMADCNLYGLRPWGHHLTSVLFHLANTVLLFLLLQRLTGRVWRSFMVAALFGLHPVHVESVAWVAERKDVLSAFFALLTLWMYAAYTKEKRHQDYWIALGFFALGLMSKPMLVTLPCVMFLLDFWPLNRWEKSASVRLIREKIPFFLMSAATCTVALVTQKTAAAPLSWLSGPVRAENSVVSYARYLGKIFYPTDLCAFYPLPGSHSPVPGHWPLMWVAESAILMVMVSGIVIWRIRQQPYLFVGWFWFVGMLVPVIGLVQVGMQAMADRYLYLPAVGIFMAVVWLVAEFAGKWAWHRAVLATTSVLVLAACVPLTWRQISYWQDSETLLNHTLAVTRYNQIAHYLLARQYAVEGRSADTIRELQESVQIEPYTPGTRLALASQLQLAGQTNEAINEYAAALQLDPQSLEAGVALGMALNRIGNYEAAIQVYQVALQSHPDVEELHLNLGNAYAHTRKPTEAAEQFRQALALKPDDVDAHNNLGAMLFQLHQLDAAAAEFQAVLKLDPQNADAQRNLQTILDFEHRKQ